MNFKEGFFAFWLGLASPPFQETMMGQQCGQGSPASCPHKPAFSILRFLPKKENEKKKKGESLR